MPVVGAGTSASPAALAVRRGIVLEVDGFYDTSLRCPDECGSVSTGTPDSVHPVEERFGLLCRIEVEVEHEVLRIIHRPQHPVVEDAASSTSYRVAVEGGAPRREVADPMFDA